MDSFMRKICHLFPILSNNCKFVLKIICNHSCDEYYFLKYMNLLKSRLFVITFRLLKLFVSFIFEKLLVSNAFL